MTTLALSALIDIAPRWFSRVGRYWTEFSTGIEEARAMALRYQTLAALSDRDLRHAASSARTFRAPHSVFSTAFDHRSSRRSF